MTREQIDFTIVNHPVRIVQRRSKIMIQGIIDHRHGTVLYRRMVSGNRFVVPIQSLHSSRLSPHFGQHGQGSKKNKTPQKIFHGLFPEVTRCPFTLGQSMV